MSRRDNAHARCPRCRVHKSLCFCDQIPRIETQTRLVLLIHHREARKPTNTGMLAAECLVQSAVMVRGQRDRRECTFALDPTRQTLLLFPGEGATLLSEFRDSPRPVTLVVPDGNWRQASKVHARIPMLAGAPMVTLPLGLPSMYGLRRETQSGGLATMEAIARALGILEGPSVQAALEHVFRIMVERTLWARGALAADAVSFGLPPLAVRHDPLSGNAEGNCLNRTSDRTRT